MSENNEIVLTLNLAGLIDDNVVASIVKSVSEQNPSPNIVCINMASGGGNINSSISLYNYLKSLSMTVHTHNLGEVSSAAILPYLAGSLRTTEPTSKFLFHAISLNLSGEYSFPKILEFSHMMEADLANYAKIVHAELPAFCEKYDIQSILRHGDQIIMPEEGISVGLVHEIKT